jgi:hypothetical protein
MSLQKQFLTAFCHSPRNSGGQQRTQRDHFADAIKSIIPELTKYAPLKLWGNNAIDKVEWDGKIKKWWQTLCGPLELMSINSPHTDTLHPDLDPEC